MLKIPTVVPEIETERLVLRQFRKGELDAFASDMTDAEATRFTGGPSDRRTAWRIFASSQGAWLIHGTGWWAVELREIHEVVGTVGAFYRDGFPDLELGWRIYKRFWRRGIATEATAAALRFAFETAEARRVIAIIDRENLASVRVAEHLGMAYEQDIDFHGVPLGRYAIHR